MEGVKRMNTVMLHPQQREEVAQRNPYVIEIDRGRNCYACGGFGHMAQYCRNREGELELGIAEDWNMGKDGEVREILNNWTI